MISFPEPLMWQAAYFATIHRTTIIITLCRIVETANVGNGVAEGNGEAVMRIRKNCGKTSFKPLRMLSLFSLSYFLPFLDSLLPSRETDRVKNKTPDTYFTPELFTDRAKRTRRTTTSRFWVIVIWSSTLKMCMHPPSVFLCRIYHAVHFTANKKDIDTRERM